MLRRAMSTLTSGANVRMVYITTSQSNSKDLARSLVESGHVACVNIVPEITSIYKWQGNVEEDAEALLIAKTTSDALTKLQEIINAEHPYDTPEFLAIKVEEGSDKYLSWVEKSVNPASKT